MCCVRHCYCTILPSVVFSFLLMVEICFIYRRQAEVAAGHGQLAVNNCVEWLSPLDCQCNF